MLATAAIHTPHIRYLAIMPEIVMFGGAVLLLAVSSLVRRPLRVTVATAGTVVISLTALGFALWQWADVTSHGPFTAVDGAVAVDGFSVLVAILVPCAMALSALVGDGYLRREGMVGPEFHVLALISASGAMLMGAANDLIVVFLGLEILSIALYVLTAFNHRRAASGEAALKYFILGGLLLGHLRLRDRPRLRRHRVDQPGPDRRLPLALGGHLRRPAAGRARPPAGRLRLQDRRRPLPHVDPRRLPGGAQRR